ncbi:MAG: XrtA/PEP-CTERM system exopolysaccharide export protein [Pseudomonadota bacterium]
MFNSLSSLRFAGLALAAAALASCGGGSRVELPPAVPSAEPITPKEDYLIGPADNITIHVWRNPELSAEDIQVRPDGRITIPLVRDMVAVGKTPTKLEADVAEVLSEYIEQPIVSVIVNESIGELSQQIRITGAGAQPAALPYRSGMTILDAMIAVGGLGEFAAGNRATLSRFEPEAGKSVLYALRLKDLLNKGDSTANVALKPGDTISIPESRF